jgi:electron transport complex protein RnfC
MLHKLFRFHGGVHPSTFKGLSEDAPIIEAPLPERLWVPLHQSAGGTPQPVAKPGEHVLKGQKIGEADGWISAAVHAPTSGTVVGIALHPFAHPSGIPTMAVEIAPDGKDEWIDHSLFDLDGASPQAAQHFLQEMGVVGLGGAVFPSHVKLTVPAGGKIQTLVINGMECEPFITCDDRLMREEAEGVVAGVAILRDLMGARDVVLALEDNKPEAAKALREAAERQGERFSVAVLPTLYPSGSFKQLIYILTGIEVPADRLPTEYGIQCFNAATAYSVWRAIRLGEPVLRRVVTVTGNVARPGNWLVPIGMAAKDVLALAKPKEGTGGIVVGGPMMGYALPDDRAPVTKAMNCLIAQSNALMPPPEPEMPCIRCGACARACPQRLQPMQMYWWSRAKDFEKAEGEHLFDCIECGCCAYVCPAKIPLVSYFRFSKGEIRETRREQQEAKVAKARFEFREFRHEREKAEKAEKLAKAAAAQAAKKAAEEAAAKQAAAQAETEPAA